MYSAKCEAHLKNEGYYSESAQDGESKTGPNVRRDSRRSETVGVMLGLWS